jgi:hypothetical protein
MVATDLQLLALRSPADASELVGPGEDKLVLRCSGFECVHPISDRCSISLGRHRSSACTVDQNL